MKNHYHTRNVVWGKIPQHVPGQYISHSFAMRVEESREEDEAAGAGKGTVTETGKGAVAG